MIARPLPAATPRASAEARRAFTRARRAATPRSIGAFIAAPTTNTATHNTGTGDTAATITCRGGILTINNAGWFRPAPAIGLVCALVALHPAAALAQAAAPAAASATVTVGVRHDSNVFRLPAGVSLGGSRGDDTGFVEATVADSFTPGDFTIGVEGALGYDAYRRHGDLDNIHYTAQVTVDRKPGAKLGISGFAQSARRLSGFADVFGQTPNIQQFTDLGLSLTLPAFSDVALLVSPDFRESTNSSAVLAANDYDRYGGNIGLRWQTPLGNSVDLTFGYHVNKGKNPRLVALGGLTRDARINASELSGTIRIKYDFSALTSVTASLSYIHRRDYTLLRHDQDGPYGDISFDYHPRKSLKLTLSGGRQQSTQDSQFIDAVRDNYLKFSARARASDRLELDADLAVDWRKFGFDPFQANALGALDERIIAAGAGATYLVGERFLIGLHYLHEARASSNANARFDADVIQATIGVRFGQADDGSDQ